jgi:hypothetical protein
MNKYIVWGLIALGVWFLWKKFGGKIVGTVKGAL